MSLRSISCLADNDPITGIVRREIGVTGATIVGLAGAFRLTSTTAGGTDTLQKFTAGFGSAVRITQRRSGVPSNSPLTQLQPLPYNSQALPDGHSASFFCWKDHDGVGSGMAGFGHQSSKQTKAVVISMLLHKCVWFADQLRDETIRHYAHEIGRALAIGCPALPSRSKYLR